MYNQGIININAIIHDYRDVFNLLGENRDEACGYNVSCPESDGYELQINASSFLDMRNGYICSGTMLNNKRNNYTPYYWTAWHCIYNVDSDEFEDFRFYFDYETSTCEGSSAGYGNFATDGLLISHSDGMDPDYALILIRDFNNMPTTNGLPDGVCYAGWDKSASSPMIASGVHHPDGQPKKINFDDDIGYSYPFIINWGDVDGDENNETSPANSHWRIRWDEGGTAGGSSGSGVFNNQGHLVGQLSGGNNDCVDPTLEQDCAAANSSSDCYSIVGCEWSNQECVLSATQDFYGKFSRAFNDVAQWLDPDNSGVSSINGICTCPEGYDVCGVCDGPGLNQDGCCDDLILDDCGVCDGNNANQDCLGVCNGNAVIDECGVCDGPGLIDCIDEYGFSQGSFCTQEECEEYLLDASDAIPTQLVLGQNYPNPFNPTTIIEYGVPTLSKTNISLYDLQGRKLKTLINSMHSPGYYHLTLTLDNLYSGIYLVKIVSDNIAKTRKIALVK